MKTNAVSVDMKPDQSNRTRRQDGDSGFSDVLGSVSSENRSKQKGLANSSRNDLQGGVGKEFRYTERADGSPRISRSGKETPTADYGSQLPTAEAETADKLLRQAEEMVMQSISEATEPPTREEIADMLIEALKKIHSDTPDAEKPEIDPVLTAIIDVIAAMTGNTADIPQDMTGGDVPADDVTIRLAASNGEFSASVVTEKHDEAGMLTGAADDEFMTTEEAIDFVSGLDFETLRQQSEQPAEKLPTGQVTFENDISLELPTREDIADTVTVTLPEGAETAKDPAELLAELIEQAKKELGLSEVKIEHVTGGEEEQVQLMKNDEAAELSTRLNRNDRTDELDHILNSGRNDAGEDKEQAVKTETYDAVHMASELINDRTPTEIRAPEQPAETDNAIRPPEFQTAEQILERIRTMQDDHTEFTMVLNPESLGKITVKLVAAGERVSVEINAENPDTRAILAARSESLQNMLRDGGVDLERYQVVAEQEDARFEQQSYEGSSRNPYGRNDGQQEHREDGDDKENFYDLLQTI